MLTTSFLASDFFVRREFRKWWGSFCKQASLDAEPVAGKLVDGCSVKGAVVGDGLSGNVLACFRT
jgi:hypothetical protein